MYHSLKACISIYIPQASKVKDYLCGSLWHKKSGNLLIKNSNENQSIDSSSFHYVLASNPFPVAKMRLKYNMALGIHRFFTFHWKSCKFLHPHNETRLDMKKHIKAILKNLLLNGARVSRRAFLLPTNEICWDKWNI